MKINKINDKQIKCILSQQDLEDRHLNLKEMSYNSAEIRNLFAEVMHLAYKNFGFDTKNVPLKIDVIPLRASAVLFFTKVEEPEELNPSYSHFSPSVYEKMKNPSPADSSELSESFKNLINAIFDAEAESEKEEDESSKPVGFAAKDPVIFSFDSIGTVIDACRFLKPTYNHKSSLYYDKAKDLYYLKLCFEGEPDNNFRQNCVNLFEYGNFVRNDRFFDFYLLEHAKLIVEDTAVESVGV